MFAALHLPYAMRISTPCRLVREASRLERRSMMCTLLRAHALEGPTWLLMEAVSLSRHGPIHGMPRQFMLAAQLMRA
eukprot:436977-Amphidinium_carterae.1